MAAPIGNVNAARNTRLFEDALRRELLAEKGKKLRALAAKVYSLAMKGNMQAATMIMDRVDGRPRQQLEHTGLNDGPIAVEYTQRERARRVAFLLAANDPENEQLHAVPKRANGGNGGA